MQRPPALFSDERNLPWRKLAAGMLLAVLVFTGLALAGDIRELGVVLQNFEWWLVVPILLLTIWNYVWRFGKWQMYLGALGVTGLDRWLSFRIYLSGFSMSLTPGKIGEVIKSVYIKRATGAPINRTSAAVAAERLTDGIAMLILATIGVLQFSYGRIFVGVVTVLAAILIFLLQNPERLSMLLDLLDRFSFTASIRHHIDAFLTASSELLRPGLLVKAVGIGLVSWAGECLAFLLVMVGLGFEATFELLLICTFVLAVSSLLGGISLLPGGLGVADASVAGMLLLLVEDPMMDKSTSVAATLLIRFATLWFGVIVGVIALISLERESFESPTAAGSLLVATGTEGE